MYARSLPSKTKTRKGLLVKLILVFAIIAIVLVVISFARRSGDQNSLQDSQSTVQVFDKTQFSLDDPTSLWVVVNKQRPLDPTTYAPRDLRAPAIKLKGAATSEAMQMRGEAATALEALDTAAKNEGIKLALVSAYRSYNSQKTIYDSEVKGFGQAVADRESARPGHSEHQTGWAADLGRADGKCEIEACFADTAEGQWLAANAYKYGFILRYAKDKTDVTGYVYEPWHLRYVGTDLAAEMHRTGTQTLEEFFDLPSAPNY